MRAGFAPMSFYFACKAVFLWRREIIRLGAKIAYRGFKSVYIAEQRKAAGGCFLPRLCGYRTKTEKPSPGTRTCPPAGGGPARTRAFSHAGPGRVTGSASHQRLTATKTRLSPFSRI